MAERKSYRWSIIFIVILLLIILGLMIMKGKGAKKGEELDTAVLGDTIQRIDDFHLTHLRGEDVEWELSAKSAITHDGDEDTSVQGIDITSMSEGGTPIKLSATRGSYNVSKNTFSVGKEEGGVYIKVGKEVTIKLDDLEWSGGKRDIHSLGKIRVVGEGFILEGEGLTANIDSGVYEINKNVRATVW